VASHFVEPLSRPGQSEARRSGGFRRKGKIAKPNLMDGAQRSQTCEPMDKNRIEPERSGDSLPAKRCGQRRHGATSWHNTAKPSGMPVEVNSAAVQRSNVPLPGEIPSLSGGQKSAEAIVVGETSRSARLHSKVAGGLPSAMQSGFAVMYALSRKGVHPTKG
jgi:hypothetical protein